MSAEVIQSKYEELETIARRFGQQAQTTRDLQRRVQRGADALRNGGWEGRGSAAFTSEMEQKVFPAMQRLMEALAEAQATTLQVKAIIQKAEEEAASVFRNDSDNRATGSDQDGSSSGTPPLGGDAAGAPPVDNQTGGNPAGDGRVTGNRPFVARDPSTLFQESYMKGLINSRFRGEDTPELNRLMESLGRNPQGAELEATLNRMADIRGVPRAEFRAQYEKYLELRAQAERINGTPEAIDLAKHGDFLGSTASLRYGKVVGDAFGIDPVFGSLLNPTGGMIGPGNSAINPADDNPVGMHGIVHDAAGYLYNYHNLGPGYDYLGQETGRPTGDPLTGQRAGIDWWLKQRQLDAPGPDILVENPLVRGTLGTVWDVGLDARQVVTGVKQGVGELFEGNWRGFGQGMGNALEGVARVPVDVGAGVVRTVGETAQEVGAAVGKISDWLGI